MNTADSVAQALEREVRPKVSFCDALIPNSAEQAGATVLYCEDLSANQDIGLLQVVNPLLG